MLTFTARIVPRCLSNSASGSSWPTRPAQASFAGPVDHESFQLRGDVWPDLLRRTSVFVKLGSYIIPEGDRAPHKGVHVCHVLVLFPINKQPWSSALSWMKSSSSPFPSGSWISCTGRVLGVLNRQLLQADLPADSPVRILAIVADHWEFIRQASLNSRSPTAPKQSSSSRVPQTPTKSTAFPSSQGSGGIISRNTFYLTKKGKEPQRLGNEAASSRGGPSRARDSSSWLPTQAITLAART